MGNCKSIIIEDEDEKERRKKHKQHAKELHEFAYQLRKQKCQFSELDINGKGKSRPRVGVVN